MLTGASLDRALRKAATRPFSKQYHRAMALAYGDDPLGRGRPIHGMRFNVDRGARVLYLGETPQVCMAEVDPGFPAGHWYCFPVEVQLDAVLHLDDASTRRSLGITLADIRVGFRGTTSFNGKGAVHRGSALGADRQRNDWPWTDKLPEFYYDPRTADPGSIESLHAKCVVVDERLTLIGSANFTNRGQTIS